MIMIIYKVTLLDITRSGHFKYTSDDYHKQNTAHLS